MTRQQEEEFFMDLEERNALYFVNGFRLKREKQNERSAPWMDVQVLQEGLEEIEEY